MAITLGVGPTDTAPSGSSTTVVVTLVGTTAGRSLLVGVRWNSASVTISSIACSGESNLVASGLVTDNGNSNRRMQWGTLDVIGTGGDKTITVTFSSTVDFRGLFAVELIGTDQTGSIVDTTAIATTAGVSSANPTVNITTANNNEAVFGMVWTNGAPTTGAGYTGISLGQNTGDVEGEYKLDAGTAGVNTVNWTAASGPWTLTSIAVKSSNPNVSKTPGVGSLVLTGLVGTVIVPILITPSVGALALGGLAPMVVAGLSPGVGSLSLTGLAGTATYSGRNAFPGVGSLSLTGLAPVPTVGFDRTPGVGSLSLTGIEGAAVLAAVGAAIFEEMTGLGEGISPAFGVAALEELTATSEGTEQHIADGAAEFERLTGLGYGPVEGAATFERLTALGQSDCQGVGNGILEVLRAENPAGYAQLEQLIAYGVANETIASTFATKVMNTRAKVITEYTNYDFNSYARIGGSYYGVGSDGLVLLDGDNDDGEDINWSFKTGQMDNKTIELKRLPEILFGLRSSGPLTIRVWKDDNTYYDYILPAMNRTTIHQHRVKPGKGMRSKHYAIEVIGINNAETEIDSMQVNFSKTTRRLG